MIIDRFRNDVPSLRACALVCHDWLDRCRCHLFNTISCSCPQIGYLGRTVESCTDWSRSSPGAAFHVKTLIVRSDRIFANTSVVDLLALIACLPNVQHLNLSWLSFTDILQPSNARPLSPLKSITVYNCDPNFGSLKNLVKLLSACPTIDVLRVTRTVDPGKVRFRSWASVNSTPQIRETYLPSYPSSALNWVHRYTLSRGPRSMISSELQLRFTHLRSIHLRSMTIAVAEPPRPGSCLDQILTGCSGSLCALHIDVVETKWYVNKHIETLQVS